MSSLIVKLGGHALDDLSATSPVLSALAEDLAEITASQTHVVLVHGGGPQIADLLTRVGLEGEFHQGLRITSPEAMGYVAMALSSVNTAIVAAMSHHGLACVGLNGADDAMTVGRSLGAPWDRAATVVTLRRDLIECLWRSGVVPVVSPVAVDERGELVNCNADVVAGAWAGEFQAATLVLLSDIDQLRAEPGDPNSSLTHVSASQVQEMIQSGAVRDGMRPKMTAALDALHGGARRVLLANGTRLHALRDVLNAHILTTEVVA